MGLVQGFWKFRFKGAEGLGPIGFMIRGSGLGFGIVRVQGALGIRGLVQGLGKFRV